VLPETARAAVARLAAQRRQVSLGNLSHGLGERNLGLVIVFGHGCLPWRRGAVVSAGDPVDNCANLPREQGRLDLGVRRVCDERGRPARSAERQVMWPHQKMPVLVLFEYQCDSRLNCSLEDTQVAVAR
jgi:hypothetical protein